MSTLKVAPEEDENTEFSVPSLCRARSDRLMLRQGQFGCHLVGGAITGLWKGDNGITCFRNRLENLMYIFLVPALIIFLLVGIGDLIKSCSRKIFPFLKSLFSKILLACNEVGCKCIHINSYLYVIQHYAVKSCILRVLAMNIL